MSESSPMPTESTPDPGVSRRTLLQTGLWMAGLAGLSLQVQADAAKGTAGSFDYASPEDNLDVLSRMWGTTEPGKLAYLYVWGPAFGMPDANGFVPLFRTESLAAVRTYPLEGGAFRYLAGQVILFTDWKTGEPLETFRNPFNDEICEVFHYRDHPLDYVLDPKKLAERYEMQRGSNDLARKLVMDWHFRGPMAYADAVVRTRLRNKLDPKEWPRESIGEWWETFESYRWQALRSEVEDRSLPSIPSFTGDFQTFKPWEPWMLMGQRPGKILSQKTAYKIDNFDTVPRTVMRYLERKGLMQYLEIGTAFHNQYKLNDAHFKEARKPMPLPPPSG